MKYKIFLMLTCIFISACNKRGKEDELSSFLGNKHFMQIINQYATTAGYDSYVILPTNKILSNEIQIILF